MVFFMTLHSIKEKMRNIYWEMLSAPMYADSTHLISLSVSRKETAFIMRAWLSSII